MTLFYNSGWLFFSVTRRSRSDVNHSLTEWTLADLTDVTLVSEDQAMTSGAFSKPSREG